MEQGTRDSLRNPFQLLLGAITALHSTRSPTIQRPTLGVNPVSQRVNMTQLERSQNELNTIGDKLAEIFIMSWLCAPPTVPAPASRSLPTDLALGHRRV